ncbi:MAG TPA: hypothetical protein VNL98_10110 [Gemmatimonadales bacterium]|nr:hypothetical protein [Gemmatimonadales bacterium]
MRRRVRQVCPLAMVLAAATLAADRPTLSFDDVVLRTAGIPSGAFIRVWTDEKGLGTYVHEAVTLTDDGTTVRFWAIIDERHQKEHRAGQWGLNCRSGDTQPIASVLLTGPEQGQRRPAKNVTRNVFDDSEQGLAVWRFVCARVWKSGSGVS